ncbi:dystonin-like isoform X6 [Salvelinus fontinalis]|uniref:dystonin-like isoform X6 n=1 Tax=Salvelinus fontinalis TaxID=8038 RepID=UPI002485A384|nr:dystonin-like isoform X6 [Salvelinus fontinalis]
MIAAAFLVLLRPYSIQVVLLLLLLLLGTIATILFFCCWHRRLRNGKHPIKSVLSGRSRSREAGLRTHHFRSEGFRHSPRHARRARARVAEEKPLVEIPQSDHQSDSSTTVRKRKVKKRVLPDFYHSVQVTPTRKPSSGSGNASLHCSMSSSADFSDEDDYSLKSGSVSPAPGDTLPWNLPRHQRHKRQIQGGSVLDPAERAVLRIADERDRVQKKTFTKWINQHLLKVRKHVNDLYEDLRDGHNLISLLEVLTGQSLPRERDFLKTLRLVSSAEACAVEQHGHEQDDDKGPREKGRMRFHRLQNVQIALDFLKRRQVKLVNIRNDDITDGNPKLTLGLIWTIILHFQISEIHVCGESEDMTAKERLLMWSQQMTEGYVGVRCNNFTTSWRDGRLFNAIIHKYRPDLVDMARVSAQTSRSNLEQAFGVAERLGVARLLDPEDVDVQTPDEKSVITYVSTLYDVFPKVPDGVDGINANDVDIKWVEYQNMVNYLSQWLKHNVAVMSDRAFPNNPVELKALYTQYLQFKENEIPLKETEKSKIKHLYKMLEVWMEFGRIQLPQGYHPNDVEKEWGKLIVAMLEREKSLRPEVDRLEMLQQIANRVQRDCVNGEDKLALARAALQSDAKRLESGVQFQNEAETAGHLLECENLLRQQVVDIQILLDGKYYYSDQLVQRVSKLRDDLLGLRAECSSVYRQGRTLTTQQTTMMISGISQSLNSGFSSSNLNSSLTPGGLGTPGSTFTSILTPGLTPALSPAMTHGGMQPGLVQAYMGGGGVGMAPGDLQHLKQMQIRKPLCKSLLVDPNMTEDEVNINFVQDLINWVEEMQVQLDRGDWGSDLPSVETHLENHKGVHRAIEDFQMSLKEAKLSEIQMTQNLSYSEKLGKLETQYGKLLNCSRERQKNLESLHDFVSRATMELIWLNEKEEEEVAFDWSDLNGNISKKRQYHSDLMRELDEKEEVIKSVQDRAENLLQENHPARLTIEAYKAAMQTQWSWILQLCSCVEQHLKDNTVYFEFFNNAKESMDYLKSLQGDIQRKYCCDRTSSVHKLEDHIQESMDEKEQLLQYRSTVAGLVGKAKAIVQLKPRNPDTPVRSSIPVKAICDYRQIEITIYKDDECVLASNSHRAKWKVISPSGNEAMVPSVCFTVPPPNKEAVDQASRIEQLYQNVLTLWHHSHIKMKSVVSWHYLMADVRAIRDWNVSSIKTMLPGEHQQVLSNLQSHFEDFLEDSKESEVFTVADCSQLEREVLACKDYYEELLKSAEREEHEESVYNLYISEVRNFRMRLEAQEEHLIRQIRTPLDRDDLEQSVLRITEQEKKKAELDQLKDDLETMKEKCETFFRQAGASPAVPTLSSDLNVLIQSMSQVYSMSAIYLEKLKTVSLVVRHSQSAEALVKLYEAKLSEEDAVNSDLKSIDTVVSTLKQWRSEIDEQREIFHDLEDGLQKARVISERMFKAHNERDFDLDWHKEKADQLEERWNNVHSQIESRLRDLEGISKSLKYYKDSYGSLDEWVREMEAAQLKTQEKQPEDSKALAELVNQQKVLVAEMEQKQSRIDECQKYSEQYSSSAKDYELQLLTYRAMVDSQHKSPLKRRRMQNSADAIIQEFMDLRTRYTAVVTSMTQYVKFASETLKRAEGEERSVDEEKKEHGDKVSKLLNWMSSVKPGENKDGKASTEASSKPQVSMEEMVTKKEKIAEALRTTQLMLSKHSDKMTEEEKQEAKEQLKSLHQAYSDLAQHCSDQTPSAEQAQLKSTYQDLLSTLDRLSGCIHDNSEMAANLDILNTSDVDTVKDMIQKNKGMETNLSGTHRHLEDAAFDIQYFISEHAQFLSPAQSRHLLKSLSATQRAFKEQTEMVAKQRRTLERHLEIREDESQQKCMEEKQKVFSDKLQELCDNLTNTENRLIGHQQQTKGAASVEDLQHVQQEHQALQKDILTNGSALNEVISSTKKFLDENRSTLTPDQIIAIESKLEDAESKVKLINQRAEESRKDLEKSVTTAIKQETEKEAAVEQLEESKNKIEGLLDWINNMGNEKEMGGEQTDHMGIQNGNMPLHSETSAKNILGEDDDPNGNNGNAFQTTDNDTEGQATGKTPELDLEKQYDRVKARHQEILSQQQELIMATQSAQALLDHQAHALSPTDKDKLQRDIQELKGRYNSSLTQAEQQMKQVVQVQEELKKFQGDCEEFEGWLQQAEGEVEELGAPAGALNDLTEKLQRQKSFSEDVISHKGDLRFITISGQKVLDVAKACGRMDPGGKDAQLEVDTTATCAAVKEKLDSAAGRFKALHSQCNDLGNNLRDVVDKYKKYEDSAAGLLKWLNNSEEDARRQQSEAIAADPQTLQKQLEDTKGLQGQTTGRQTAVETLRKTADSLVTAQGDLLTNQDHIHETVDDIVERYDNLSKSVSDRNEKLQITLTRSLSVQDGLDEMMRWMEGVEESVKEKGQVPLDSAAIGDVLSKEAALEQDISSRQSSISAMKAKVKKFVETADPAAAALLQSKMDALSQRFSDACDKHKHKQGQLEQLKDKVEEFEKTTEKVQQFVLKRSQVLSETDGPGKNVNELSQLMQDTNTELAEHAKDVEMLQMLSNELANMGPEGSKAQIQRKMDKLSNTFNAFKNTVKEKEEEVSSCQDQLGDFRAAAGALRTWLEETTEKVPVVQPTSSEQSLAKDLKRVNALMEEWTTKGSAVQDINSKGSALCSLISVLTSPAKTKMSHKSAVTNSGGPGNHAYLTNKELMVVQQNMSYINEGHESLGEVLKGRATELSVLVQEVTEAQKETDAMITWLQDMKKTAASWNSASTEKDTMKTQLEQQKAFEEDMKQKREQLQKLREKLLHLIEKHPDSPEAAKWKQMLSQIDAAWADVSGSVEDRKQCLEESNRNLDVFQTTEPQLRQWLSEKNMMLSVLGPLSMDPNMLNTQKQQVQILLNEFDSRKPQFDQLHEAAAAILSTSGKQDPSSGGKVVKDQLAAVTQKWQGLTGQLGQRAGLIDQAVGKSSEFQDLLMSLSQSAASLETRLNSQQALSSQPDVVKKQLEEANNISGQLREERKRLKEAETLCSELSALVTEDYLKAGLDRQLEGVTKPFKQLEDKAGKRIQQLNSAFASSQQFHQTSKDFQGWMNEKLQEQSKSQAISAQVETLRQSLKEQSALQKALSEHEEQYSTIVREGETLLQNTDGAEKVAMQGQLATLRSNWDDVKKSSAERQDKLQGALQRVQKYHEHAEKLQSWVQECEAREGSVRLSVDPAEVESSISQLKAIQKDVDKHRGLVEQLNTAADSLLEVANADTEAVREEKAAIGQSVDRVTEGVQNKRESLEKISQRLKEFNDTHNEAKGQLAGAKKQLDAHTSLGVQAYSNKNLTNMKAQQKSLDGVNTQVEHLKSLAQGLVADVPEADGVTDLLLQADSLEKEHGSLSKDVGETCSTLEGKLQGIGQFQTNIREMFTRFADLDDELDSMASVGRDLITLKEQQGSIKGFVEKLQELMADTARGGDSCKKMLETEASPDLLGLKRDLDALSKQCGKLIDRAKGRGEEVGSTLTRLVELYSKLQQFTNKLGGAEVKEEGQGSLGMETDVINQQLEAFKVFQKEVDPLQSQLQDINWLGQGLIQNADKGTSTKGLELDLEDVNTRWNTLNKKIAERSVQLHEALLHCGRFQDALESLLSWLTDTEDLVSNQKPPSAEFKVVKAQIQEQILLQRLLDDRRPTVELIKKEGGKVAELGAESVDKEKVGKEIECLGQRWDALLKKAENRHKQLKSILVVAQQFHETLEPLSEWLSATEKHLAKAEPIGTQTSKLEEQISQHKVLEEEIMDHSKDLVQAVNLGQMLKLVSSVDDKELVQSKLDSSQASYVELQERCRRKAEMLQQALTNAQLFGEDEVALMNWLNEVHTRLSEVSVKDYKTDVLEKQCAEQLALHEDIELRKQNVDQAISNGLELLKQTTGDEVVVIQGKLDGIKMRYAEINSMSDNVSKTLDQALTLASKLQHTHEDLSSWLKNVEAELTAFTAQAPVGEQLVQAQDRQKALLKEARDHKPQVDKLNEVSSSLLELVPWRAREGLDKIVTEDNDRYKATSDTIAHHVEQIDAAILKSQQFEQAADTELAWLTEAERKMLSLGEIRLEQDQTTVQLQSQKSFSMDIMRHKDAVDGVVKTGQAIMNSKDEEEKQALKAKIQALLEKYAAVSQLNSERCLQLERAQSLASQFWETYEELWPWLQETRTSFSQLPLASIEYEALRQQQEELRQMRELIAEHKPYIDKMNKTGPQLLELSPVAGVAIREKYTATDLLYAQLKADVKQRAFTLDEAISKSTQFHDKIEPMLESLERIAERLRQPPSISVEVEKIREQITENKVVSADLEKLQPSYDTLKQRGEEMIARSAGADKDISAKAVQDKLDRMVFTWNEIHALMEEREAKLLDVMDLADKFWCDHCALIVTIKDTQDLLRELEEPGVDPSVVKQQQEYLESFKEEIDGLQEELDVVRNLGAELMAACGEPDKPVIKKSIDEVNLAWETLNKAWKERVDRLDEAMQAAVQFQDGLQGMFDWVDIVEHKLGSMSPVGTDLDTVKQQIEELKEFKGEAYQLQMEMERLNHQAGLLLKKVTEEYDRCAIQEPMTELKMLWDNLDEKIINRQHKLEGALLALGQFQHALDELLAWMSNTEELLNEQRKAVGDPKAIEIKLAKHHVLQNDVLAHKTTVEAVNKAGTDLVESTSGEEAAGLQNKLENLTQRWKNILEKTEQRRQQLDSALLQAQGFHGEIEDMQQWLKDTERQLLASKAVGGLPDTAREQLNAHLELCSTMEAKEELYQQLMNKGQQLLTMTPSGQDSNTEQDLRNLQDKWESVQAKVAERKVKLEEALALAIQFHNSLQDFINWLTQAEQTLTMSSPASLILETILFQIDEHKVFVTEVNSHRQQIIELDKTGTHLKYFSQKQDVVLIKNLLISVQGRWEKVVQRSVERGRLLDDTRKRAKQFHETWNKLTEWLDDSEKALDSELEIANDPDKIKTQLAQHKEFQKVLGSKHSVYDTTSRTGRALKDKTSLQDDNQKLDDMLSELRDKWDTVCGKSVERQNKLEEALLFSGQFTDALQALIDWLYRVEPQLAEDQPVHGDIDLVLNLIDSHKVFQKELGKRTGSVAALKRSAKDLIESSHEDSSWVKAQMQELSARWETVCARSVSKQTRLEQALSQAEEFHSTVHMLLEWLAEAEQSLRFHGTLPDDEEALGALIEQHKEFMKKQEEKRVGLNKATSMGEAILTICHPDSITTIKHWNTIIKARFEEVQAWARQHQQRLAMALSDLLATKELLEGLLGWLQWAETTLNDKDKEVLPQEIDEVKALIAEHQTFMEEMTRKQPDVDKITKTHKRKAVVGSEPASQSHIPVLEKGRGKRSPTQAMYPSSQPLIETKNPRVNLLVSKWQQVWLLALDRRRKLNDAMDRLEELKEFANFDFDVWRKRYMRWMNHKKSRVMDFFRRIDKDQDGKVTRQEFIEGILSSKFPTSRLEMSAVADIFDRDGDGYIDYYEFVAALHPNKEAYKPLTDADKIEDEVTRQVAKCKCPKRFQVEQIGANKYRFYLGNQFGDSQQLRLVRILRSTVMVRVGGGWMALDEFLVKNDPCRVHHHGSKMLRSESNSSITQSPIGWQQISHFLTLLHEPPSAKGRTNMELREKFILPEGTTQVMASFRYRGRRSRPSSRAASPNRSNSNHSCPAQHNNTALTSTPKTPQHITRNYDKPWLTNSKPSSPLKSSDSFESQGSSSESIPIQGSKLRLPGYLSGKGFQSGEEQGTLINAAVMKARGQAIGFESRRPGSRPGSKAGSRGSSRRGSDASDFDISDIASVCSETSEMVGDTSRGTPRSSSRQHGGKPSKIPTPQRRSTPSKLAKASKR